MNDLLRNSLLTKVVLLLGLLLLLCYPLAQIGWLVEERGASQQQAARELASTYAGPQTLIGPLLVVPYVERWTVEQRDGNGKLNGRLAQSKAMTQLIYPERLELTGTVMPQERQRGIYKVLFYGLQGGWHGSFAPLDAALLAHS
jgi:inner membrane protein